MWFVFIFLSWLILLHIKQGHLSAQTYAIKCEWLSLFPIIFSPIVSHNLCYSTCDPCNIHSSVKTIASQLQTYMPSSVSDSVFSNHFSPIVLHNLCCSTCDPCNIHSSVKTIASQLQTYMPSSVSDSVFSNHFSPIVLRNLCFILVTHVIYITVWQH